MTDKKLLEEFREFVDFMYESIDLEDHQRFIAISESMLKDGWFKWIYKLAKEQAERVHELEDELENLETDLWHANHFKILANQKNKRYRETMESSVSEIKYALYSNKSKDVKEHYLKNAERYITEALEDEEMYYVAVDIGCIECGEESSVIGIYTNKEEALKVTAEHEKRQGEKWGGEHHFEIYEVPEINKTYRVEY